MLRHVILFRLADPDAHGDELVSRLMALPDQIPEIREYEAGRDVSGAPNSFDVGLWSSFDDTEGLERYRVHPAHQEVVAYLEEVSPERIVVDWLT
ncbi:MAG: Dabb family protein [Acidimicrobiales bacterium]